MAVLEKFSACVFANTAIPMFPKWLLGCQFWWAGEEEWGFFTNIPLNPIWKKKIYLDSDYKKSSRKPKYYKSWSVTMYLLILWTSNEDAAPADE